MAATNALWDVCLGPMDFVTDHGSLKSTQRNEPCTVCAPAQRTEPLMPWLRYPMGGSILLRDQDIRTVRPESLTNPQHALDLFERLPLDLNAYFAMISTLDEPPHPLYGRYYGPVQNAYPLEYVEQVQPFHDDWIGAAYVARYLIPLQAWAFANRRFVVSKTGAEWGTSHLHGPCLAMFDEDNIVDEDAVRRYAVDSPVETLDIAIHDVSYMTFCCILHKRIHGITDTASAIKSTFVCTYWTGLHFMPLRYDTQQVVTLAQHSQVLPEDCTAERLFEVVDYINNVKERTMVVPKSRFMTEGMGSEKKHYAFRLPLVMQHLAFGLYPIWNRRQFEEPHRDWLDFERVALMFTPRKTTPDIHKRMRSLGMPTKWFQTLSPDVPVSVLHTSCLVPSEFYKPILVHDWSYGPETPDWLLLELNHFGRLWWLWYSRDRTPQGQEVPDQDPWIELTRPEDRRAFDCVAHWGRNWCAAQLVMGFGITESLAYRLLIWSEEIRSSAPSASSVMVGRYRLPHVTTRSMADLVTDHRRLCWEFQSVPVRRLTLRAKELAQLAWEDPVTGTSHKGLTRSLDRCQLALWIQTLRLGMPSEEALERYLAHPTEARFDDDRDWVYHKPTAKPTEDYVQLMPMNQFHGFVLGEIDSALALNHQPFPLRRVQGQRPVPSHHDQAFSAMIQRITSSIAVPLRKGDKSVRDYFHALRHKHHHWAQHSDVELASVLLIQLCASSAHPNPHLIARLIQTLQQRYPVPVDVPSSTSPSSSSSSSSGPENGLASVGPPQPSPRWDVSVEQLEQAFYALQDREAVPGPPPAADTLFAMEWDLPPLPPAAGSPMDESSP